MPSSTLPLLLKEGTFRMSSRETREVLLGICSIFVLAGVLLTINTRSQHPAVGKNNMWIFAKFNRIDGLSDGAEVRMGGIAVGQVIAMKLDPQFRAEVTMSIETTANLPLDSSASIHTDGLFGSKFIVIEPGAESSSVMSGGELVYTQDAVIVSDLLELIISEGKSARTARGSSSVLNKSGG
tara:strand:- start:23 stop:568 length:546 start_codon:yes stop_codon:yes gene_type:complete